MEPEFDVVLAVSDTMIDQCKTGLRTMRNEMHQQAIIRGEDREFAGTLPPPFQTDPTSVIEEPAETSLITTPIRGRSNSVDIVDSSIPIDDSTEKDTA